MAPRTALILLWLMATAAQASLPADLPFADTTDSLHGRILPGPMVATTVGAIDSHGNGIGHAVTDATGRFRLSLPPEPAMPIWLVSGGGYRLPGGSGPELLNGAVVFETTGVVTVSPFTSLAGIAATCGRDQAAASEAAFKLALAGDFPMSLAGLDGTTTGAAAPSAILTTATIGSALLASVLLEETLMRAAGILEGAGVADGTGTVTFGIGCDLSDGRLDGKGHGAVPAISAAFALAGAWTLTDLLAGNLTSRGLPVEQEVRTTVGHLTGVEPAPGSRAYDPDFIGGELVRLLSAVVMLAPEGGRLPALLQSLHAALANGTGVHAGTIPRSLASEYMAAVSLLDSHRELAAAALQQFQAGTPPAPTVALDAYPKTASLGEPVTFEWSARAATSCQFEDLPGVKFGASSRRRVQAIDAPMAVSLTCQGPGGEVQARARVEIALPVIELAFAEPSPLDVGSTAELVWTVRNADRCEATGAWTGSVDTANRMTTGPLMFDSTFGLECTGPGGTASSSAVARVRSARLRWHPPTLRMNGSEVELAGYRIRYRTSAADIEASLTIDDPATTDVIVPLDLGPGRYEFTMLAFDAAGRESPWSAPVYKQAD